MRVVVNGASGWLGQSTGHVLSQSKLVLNSNDLLLFGSKDRIAKFGIWEAVPQFSLHKEYRIFGDYDLFVQLSFKTRDYFEILGEEKYVKINRDIIQKSIELLINSKPKYVVLVSSGAVTQYLELNRENPQNTYAKLKLEEEESFIRTCSKLGSELLILRLWSASGADMPNPKKYAIGNLIFQSLYSPQIKVNSPNFIFRRYIDSRNQMEIAIRGCINFGGRILNSGGFLIEIGELALRIRDLLSPTKTILRDQESNLPADSYFSTDTDSADLARILGIPILSINNQIRHTAEAFKI